MSNRALVAILIIIIVLLAGAAVFYSQQKNSRKLADSGTQASEPESPKGDEPLQEASSTPPQNPAPDTDQTANGECKRNFISSKLQDAMNIKNDKWKSASRILAKSPWSFTTKMRLRPWKTFCV